MVLPVSGLCELIVIKMSLLAGHGLFLSLCHCTYEYDWPSFTFVSSTIYNITSHYRYGLGFPANIYIYIYIC